jgi:heme-degrading monooxygenase HmoA
VARWRQQEAHRSAQAAGRDHVFSDYRLPTTDYRLRVATVVRDYGMHGRAQAPADSRREHG